MSSWAAALRIARRDALRARGRSALVLTMVALPVMGMAALDVAVRTYDLSAEQQATRVMGRADAALTDTGQARIAQFGSGDQAGYERPEESCVTTAPGEQRCQAPSRGPVDLTALLPAGSRSVPDTTAYGRVSAPGRSVQATVRELAYADPVARGTYRQQQGREPVTADEVALTQALADRLDASVGDEVGVGPSNRVAHVVGVVADADDTSTQTALVGPGGLSGAPVSEQRLLVDLPSPLTWALTQQLNERGVLVRGRGEIPGSRPAPYASDPLLDREALTVVTLVAGMALLEIVLLAGPAFAVGTKRQARVLALVCATGGDRRHVRRVVLAGGLVLGLTAGALGVAGGIVLGANADVVVGRLDSSVPGPVDLRPVELLAIAAVGVLTALLAALLPAFLAARQDVVASLTGRRGARRSSRAVPLVGVAAAVVGALIAFEGARRRDLDVVLGGSVVAELGLVALTPVLVGLAGRLGPLLPAAPRLALRDASRNRGRTAPAVAAILAAVAGSVAVGTFVSSLDAKDRRDHVHQAVPGSTMVQLRAVNGVSGSGQAFRAEQAVRRQLRVEAVTAVHTLDTGTGADGGPVVAPTLRVSEAAALAGEVDGGAFGTWGLPLVGGADVLEAVTGARSTVTSRVLAVGGVVVPSGYVQPDGTALLAFEVYGPGADAPPPVRVPAVALPPGTDVQAAVLSPAAAARTGLPLTTTALVLRTDGVPDDDAVARAQAALEDLELGASVYVERGYQSDYGAVLYVLLGASALLVLGASGIATGLAAADGRADLATLAAVGATPSLRRRLAGCQSVVTAGLGTALGVVAGLVPALGLIGALNSPVGAGGGSVFATGQYPYALPWTNLLVTAVVVPLVAGLAAVALTRSRLPLVGRAS